MHTIYSKSCVKLSLSKRPKVGFKDQLLLNAGQKYFRMLQREHSVILLIFIKQPFVIEIFVLSIFEWSFYTGFTVALNNPKKFFEISLMHLPYQCMGQVRVWVLSDIWFQDGSQKSCCNDIGSLLGSYSSLFLPNFIIGLRYGFPCIKVCQIPRDLF